MSERSSDRHRVVVTGIGVVTASGLDEESLWENLLAGRTGIAPITAFERRFQCL